MRTLDAVTTAARGEPNRRGRRPAAVVGIRVFAVDDESVQLTWRSAPAGPLCFGADLLPGGETVAAAEVAVPGPGDPGRGGPGAVVLERLAPGSAHRLWVAGPDGRHSTVATVRTLERPRGALLCRVATLNDIHIGERQFGLAGRLEDRHPLPPGTEPYPQRCARAALREAAEWGAGHVVVKGDLTRDSEPAEFRAVGQLLKGSGMAADVVLGNHDVRHGIDAHALLEPYGIDARPTVRHRDLPGLRLVLAHTPGPGDQWGQMLPAQADQIARLTRHAGGPCMVVVHHPPATTPVTLQYPPGIYRAQSAELLRRLAIANPQTFVVSGHTHRNRVRWSHGIRCVETASTKDFPGQWTGYRVFEGGIVQTARRVAAPSALEWTDASARALGGQWGRWAPGRMADRSWSQRWGGPR